MSPFTDFWSAREHVGKEVCFKPTQRCEHLLSEGIKKGTLVNVQQSPKFKGKKGNVQLVLVVEFGPNYHRRTSYFLKEDVQLCNGHKPPT